MNLTSPLRAHFKWRTVAPSVKLAHNKPQEVGKKVDLLQNGLVMTILGTIGLEGNSWHIKHMYQYTDTY